MRVSRWSRRAGLFDWYIAISAGRGRAIRDSQGDVTRRAPHRVNLLARPPPPMQRRTSSWQSPPRSGAPKPPRQTQAKRGWVQTSHFHFHQQARVELAAARKATFLAVVHVEGRSRRRKHRGKMLMEEGAWWGVRSRRREADIDTLVYLFRTLIEGMEPSQSQQDSSAKTLASTDRLYRPSCL